MITRVVSAAVLGIVLSGTTGATANAISDNQALRRDVYPKALFFREAERIGKSEDVSYQAWSADVGRLMGIIGKVLNEELPNITSRGSESFKRFKKEYPSKVVLNHYNGNARDPRYERSAYFDGHWLYYNGARILRDVPATIDDTEIQVDDPRLFKTGVGRYANASEDIGLSMLDERGKPDWSRAEQVTLISVDLQKSTITVRRGQYGTKPLLFPAGKAYAAAHMHTGPWGEHANLLWRYNHSTTCPQDKNGKRAIDVRVSEIKAQFGPGGPLEGFDGLEFDVLLHDPGKAREHRGPDCDADGVVDNCVIDERQVYGVGVIEFMQMLRRELGDDKLILGDGHSSNHNRAFAINNGIESEGWPSYQDDAINDWSGGLNRHYFWRQNGRAPQFSYIAHKYARAKKAEDIPYSTHRLVFAAAAFTDSAVAFGLLPSGSGNASRRLMWDEFVMGADNKLGWLGKPVGNAVHLADRSPDLLHGDLSPPKGNALSKVQGGPGTRCGIDNNLLACISEKGDVSFVTRVPVPSNVLTLRVIMSGSPMENYPPQAARLMHVELANSNGVGSKKFISYVNDKPFVSRFFFSELAGGYADVRITIEGQEPVIIESVTAHNMPDVVYREFENGLVLANPGLRSFAFDMEEIAPGRGYRRLKATAGQDIETNSGKPIGHSVQLGMKDGLFLVRTD